MQINRKDRLPDLLNSQTKGQGKTIKPTVTVRQQHQNSGRGSLEHTGDA